MFVTCFSLERDAADEFEEKVKSRFPELVMNRVKSHIDQICNEKLTYFVAKTDEDGFELIKDDVKEEIHRIPVTDDEDFVISVIEHDVYIDKLYRDSKFKKRFRKRKLSTNSLPVVVNVCEFFSKTYYVNLYMLKITENELRYLVNSRYHLRKWQ